MKPQQTSAAGGRRIWLELQAISLSKHCPIDRSKPGSCPLCGVRSLGVRERRAWVRGLTLDELEYLVTYHACCAAEKERTTAGRPKGRSRFGKR